MNILLTADPELPVPPSHYGGIERIVDQLAAQYRASGHRVVLVANRASTCEHTDQRYAWPADRSMGAKSILQNAFLLWKVYQKEQPDVIHSFSRLLYLYPLVFERTARILQSYQRAIHPRSTLMASRLFGKHLQFTACAAHLYQGLPVQDRFHTVYNFTDTRFFTPAAQPSGDYLLFLGRIEPIKGAAEAVQVALRTGRRLILAGNIPESCQSYFEETIRPYLQAGHIEYVGPVNDAQKLPLYQHAAAFLFPISWEEPFGIVMAESLACGTPVIAFGRGSVPEVVENGVNGFVCKNTADMESAIGKIGLIDRADCRHTAETRFSAEVVGKQYLALLQQHRYA